MNFRALRENIFTKKQTLQRKQFRYSALAEALEIISLFFILFGVVQQAFLEIIAIGLLVVYIQGLQRIQSNLKNFFQALVNLFQFSLFPFPWILRTAYLPIKTRYRSMYLIFGRIAIGQMPSSNMKVSISATGVRTNPN